jgi:hypothetical protein
MAFLMAGMTCMVLWILRTDFDWFTLSVMFMGISVVDLLRDMAKDHRYDG